MIKAAKDSSRYTWSGMSRELVAALGLLLGVVALPAQAQTAVPGDRLCTAGFNTDYGWFDAPSIDRLGVLEFPGQLTPTGCVSVTPARLAVQLGGITLPLSGEVVYSNLGSASPTLTTPLLEPALCEDYYIAGGGSTAWRLVVKDANDQVMIDTVNGVSTLEYNLASGAMVPQRADTSAPWLRCYSGLAPNASGGGSVPDANALFADGMESEFNLQLEFLDESGAVLGADVVDVAANVDAVFTVRISNHGTTPARDVRVSEFVPTSNSLLGPVVTRVGCKVGSSTTGTDCSGTAPNFNGVGTNRFLQHLGDLAPGQQRTFTLTRRSSGTDTSGAQAMALIQVAVFSKPDASIEMNQGDNSRSLRIRVVDQIQVTRGVTTNGASGGIGGTINRVSVPAGCSAEAGAVTTCPPGTTGLVYSAAAASGYTFIGFTGCTGTPSSVGESGGAFTTTSTISCAVTANFRSMPTVTASAGANGAISPPSQAVHYGTPAQFTVTPNSGYAVDNISGCGGVTHVSGATWQTSAVTANCAVNVSFKVPQFAVTATAVGNGSVSPAAPNSVTVQYGQAATFAVTPGGSEYDVVVTGSCPSLPGAWFGSSYMVPNITQDCQVQFEFVLITHPVSVSPNLTNGSLVLDSPTVVHGGNAGFTVVPATGYHLDGAVTNTGTSGACGTISLAGSTGTAGPITSAGCELSANFAINQYTATISVAAGSELNGTIAPMGSSPGDVLPVVIDPITHGTSAEFWTFAASGYYAAVVPQPGCNFIYAGVDTPSGAVKFRANAVTANCNLEVQFLQ